MNANDYFNKENINFNDKSKIILESLFKTNIYKFNYI